MDNIKIVDKIKKLLALATSDNPGEAENALLMARKLMARHKLTDKDIADKRPNKLVQVVYEDNTFSPKRNPWLIDLAHVIGDNHCCAACMTGFNDSTVKKVKFAGLDDDPMIALELLDYAVQHIKTKAKEYRASIPDYWGTHNKNEWTRAYETNFAQGFMAGLKAKYDEQNRGEDQEVMAFVAVKPVEVLDWTRSLRTVKWRPRQENRNEAARSDGYRAGYNFNPTKQINA